MVMAFTKQLRNDMESLIYTFFSKLDPSGANTAKYKAFFGKMSDAEFKSFFDRFFKDRDMFLTLDVEAYKNDLKVVDCIAAAKVLNVPLFEYVMQPFYDTSGKPVEGKVVASANKVPVGYIHMKPVQQMVRKKNNTSITIDQRDPRTGQVTGDDKSVQFSIDENYGLMAHNAKSILKEFMSVRADDMVAKQEAYADIRKNGYMSLADLTDEVKNKTALNTMNTYMLAMHIKTDLVDEGYMLEHNLERQERSDD
jgi:hypothetical protein